MTDEQRRPGRQVPESGGGLTDATGSLTPDEPDAEFVPAELRAVSQPGTAHAMSVEARRRNAAEQPGADRPGSLDERPQATLAPNERDGGYGSEHGLAADDPAYDFSERRAEQGPGRPPREVVPEVNEPAPEERL